jgi:hypothetical protein
LATAVAVGDVGCDVVRAREELVAAETIQHAIGSVGLVRARSATDILPRAFEDASLATGPGSLSLAIGSAGHHHAVAHAVIAKGLSVASRIGVARRAGVLAPAHLLTLVGAPHFISSHTVLALDQVDSDADSSDGVR